MSIKKNLSASTYGLMVYLAGQLALTAVLLHFWGEGVYAQWLVLYTIPAYFALSDAGIASSFGNALALAVEQRRFADAGRMARAVWRWQFVIWAGAFAMFATALVTLPVRLWLGLEAMDGNVFVAAAAVLAVYSLGTIQAGYYSAVFRAGGMFARYLFISANLRVLEVLALGGAAALGGSIVVAAICLLGLRLIVSLWCHLQCQGMLSDVELRRGDAPWSDFSALLPSGFGFLGFSLGNALINQGATLVVSRLGGAQAVIMLSVGRQLSRIFLQGVSVMFGSFHPVVSVAYAQGDLRQMANLQMKALTLVLWTGPLFCVGMALAGPPVIALWTNGTVFVSIGLCAALGAEACIAGLGNAAMLAAWAASQHLSLCAIYLVTQVVALAVAWLAFPAAGLAAFPLAFIVIPLVHVALALRVSGVTAGTTGWRLLVEGFLGTSFWRLKAI